MLGKRFTRALVVAATASLVMAATAFAADGVLNDQDFATPGNQNTIEAAAQTRGTQFLVNGSLRLEYAGNQLHLAGGSTVVLELDSAASSSGVSAGDLTFNVPSTWADGSFVDPVAPSSISYTPGAAEADGTHTLTVQFKCKSGCVDTGPGNTQTLNTANARVFVSYILSTSSPTNSAPEITSAAFAASSIGCRVSSTLSVSFTDADEGDTHTATVDWGDGSALENLGTVASPFSANHTYTSPGSYTATVTVNDGTDSDSATANITVNQTYTVGFEKPLVGSAPAELIGNTFKNGRVVPVKATIYDDCALTAIDGTSGVTPTVKLTKSALSGSTGTDAVEEYADAGQSSGNTSSMRWSDDGFWIYNLDSKALGMKTGESYRLNIFIGATQATVAQWVILSPTK